MPGLSILVVEDDRLARDNIALHLAGNDVEYAENEAQARKKLAARDHDICFIDLQLGDDDTECSGLKLIPLAAEKGSYSVVMSGHDSDQYVEKAHDLGVNDFFAKGKVGESVAEVLARFEQRRRRAEAADLLEEEFVTTDPSTRASINDALKFAASELPILILGPSGTGKTSLAEIIHKRSGRRGAFVAINCASYSEEMLEVELFGHRKGAFTGATESRKGKLLLADGGTLFLDEVGAMSAKMQTKLLKALEEQAFYPLGSEEPERSRFRIVSATLEDPASLIGAGKLRLDFFQRIHGFTIKLAPLAQRTCDILPLVARFNRQGRKLSFTPEAKERLQRHSWPGNVRELKKLVELLKADESGRVTEQRVEQLLISQPLVAIQEVAQPFTEEQYHYALEHGLKPLIDRMIQAVIRRSLAENGGKKRRAVAMLKINNRMLYKALGRTEAPAPEGGTKDGR